MRACGKCGGVERKRSGSGRTVGGAGYGAAGRPSRGAFLCNGGPQALRRCERLCSARRHGPHAPRSATRGARCGGCPHLGWRRVGAHDVRRAVRTAGRPGGVAPQHVTCASARVRPRYERCQRLRARRRAAQDAAATMSPSRQLAPPGRLRLAAGPSRACAGGAAAQRRMAQRAAPRPVAARRRADTARSPLPGGCECVCVCVRAASASARMTLESAVGPPGGCPLPLQH